MYSSFLTSLDAAWDRSSPSLWSTTSCYTSDSARSTPQTSPAIRRRQPPKPLPKPLMLGRSRRQIFEQSSSLGSSARSLVSPSRSIGSPSRSLSPATSDHSSKGMQMFLRQMEKLSRFSDDEGSCLAMHAWEFWTGFRGLKSMCFWKEDFHFTSSAPRFPSIFEWFFYYCLCVIILMYAYFPVVCSFLIWHWYLIFLFLGF